MAGERRIKGAANETLARVGPRGTSRATTGGSRKKTRTKTGARTAAARAGSSDERRERQKRQSKKVVPLPRGRQRHSRLLSDHPSAKKAVGHGRLRLVVGVVAIVCLSLGARAAQLSVADDERYQAFAAERHSGTTVDNDSPRRGSIVSADGQRLATSLDAARVIATPYQIKNPKETAETLTEVLGSEAGSAAEIEGKLTEKNEKGELGGYSVVAEGVEPEKAREVVRLGMPGMSIEPDEKRVYPNGALASQLMGYVGTDKAYGGVEARYDEVLESGQEVSLTLDTAVQQELERALESAAEEYEGKNALGVVMRVEDGALVALANTPDFDNNDFGEASEEVKRNRALTDPYEPGSTFKAFTMASALEEGAVFEESAFVIPDFIPVSDVVIHDSEPHETKVLTPKGILEQSSNVGTTQVAQALGGERLVQHIKRFGFGERTGVDAWGEDAGFVLPFEEWSGSSIGNIPIGQGITVTPLQLAAGYAALANGGLKVTPYLNQAVAPSEPGSRVISKETSSIVRGMLQGVVDEGTGHLAQIPGYTVAGKTGTAQKVDPDTGRYGDEYVTSFIGFAPAEDPEYLALLLVDEPQKDLFGEVVAAPAFQDLMSFILGYYNVPPDRLSTKEDPPPPDPTPAPDARKEDRIRR